jgi:hypothetical protein
MIEDQEKPIKKITLNVSGKELKCSDIAYFMYIMRVQSRISSNDSIYYKKNKGTYISERSKINNKWLLRYNRGTTNLENGCKIKIDDKLSYNELYNIWSKMKQKFNFNCACISTDTFTGCTNKYF